jgi:[ribosomal protein S5]-alanine N-acetyltransferase
MEAIETERLRLRNFTPEDWQDLHTMILQYVATPYAAYDHQWPTSEEELQQVARWFASGDQYLAVCLRPEGQFIGFVCLNPEEGRAQPTCNLGYIFSEDYHGQGYATEACRAVLERAFTVLGAERVITGTPEANLPSCRLLARLGLTPMEEPGMYALSREEWQANR